MSKSSETVAASMDPSIGAAFSFGAAFSIGAVLFGAVAADKGAMMACGCIFMAMVLSMMKITAISS